MTQILQFEQITSGAVCHAALATVSRRQTTGLEAHAHDFYELFLVLDGAALHRVNGAESRLDVGDLVLMRPPDSHSFEPLPRRTAHFVNVAFSRDFLRDFAQLGGLAERHADWLRVPMPPSARLEGEAFDRCARSFRGLTQRTQPAITRLDLLRFLTEVTPLLSSPEPLAEPTVADAPAWLTQASAHMLNADNLRGGVARFAELAGVSGAHLSRTLARCTSQTPTDFVNDLRLRRAAQLLATSPMEIADVALDCGFDNLSYFYRLFRVRYGRTPREHRLGELRRVVP